MRAILVVSHGTFANGLLDSLEMLCGQQEGIYTLSMEHSDSVESFSQKLAFLEPELRGYDQVLVLADLVGGTPCKAAFLNYCQNEKYRIIGGVNLGLLLEATDEDMSAEALVEIGRSAISEITASRLMGADAELDE